MLKYYFLIALRHSMRSKFYTAISILGLTVGLASVLLITLYVNDELSYENWLPGYEEIYRANPISGDRRYTGAPTELGQWLRQDYPQFSAVTRFIYGTPAIGLDSNPGGLEYNQVIAWADPNIFEMFQLTPVYGTLDGALDRPNTLVLTREVAQKFYQDGDPLGEVLILDREHPMEITAVIEDLPYNTHLQMEMIGSGLTPFSPLAQQDLIPIQESFGTKSWSVATYVRAIDRSSIDIVSADLGNMLDRNLPRQDGRKNSEIYQIELQGINDIHLSNSDASIVRANVQNVYSLSVIAVLILITVAVNYVNLMTARGATRAREIAIRKTVGAERSVVASQFLHESAGYVLIGFALAVLLAFSLLPVMNAYLERDIAFTTLTSPSIILVLMLVLALTVLFAGTYPALVLSRYSPLSLFRSGQPGKSGFPVRAALSALQFAILTGLMICAYVIYQQAQFGIEQSLRQIDDPVVHVRAEGCPENLKSRFSQVAGVKSVGCVAQIPQLGIGFGSGMSTQGRAENESIGVRYDPVDTEYLQTLGLELVAGRYFSDEFLSDFAPDNNEWLVPQPVILNESGIDYLGFDSPQQALGSLLSWRHIFRMPNTFTPVHDAVIVGVLEDFEVGSVRTGIPGTVFYVQPEMADYVAVRMAAETLQATLQEIDSIWAEIGEPGPIDREFLDQRVEQMYRRIIRQSQLIGAYTGVAIFISLLGLIGLATFVAEKRTREIGIRKVLGASRSNITQLLLWQFSKPIIISNLLAWPVAYYYLSYWLEGFSSHIDLNFGVFLAAGGITFAASLATVYVHALRTSDANPIDAIKTE